MNAILDYIYILNNNIKNQKKYQIYMTMVKITGIRITCHILFTNIYIYIYRQSNKIQKQQITF